MAMKLERPAWTICFGLIWAIIAVGAVFMHLALGTLVPAVAILPDNLHKGFYVVFGFDSLAAESENIRVASADALAKCNVVADIQCQAQSGNTCNGQSDLDITSDTNKERNAIVAAFDRGLEKIKKIGNDKYFGQDALKDAAKGLDNITASLNDVPGTGPCCVSNELYCSMYKSAGELVGMAKDVTGEIDKMIEDPAVKEFKKNADYLKFLHALPYILVLSTLFFAVLWCKNGACCCCKNGTVLQCCCIVLPQALLWLVSFVIMTIFAVVGYAVQYVLLEQKVDTFEGEPTVGDLLDHIQNFYAEFWELVFKELVDGLEQFRTASTIFVVACMIVVIYTCCFCCCRPYAVNKAEVEETSPVKDAKVEEKVAEASDASVSV